MSKARWFVRSNGAILARNGRWYVKLAGIEDIKWYSSEGRLNSAMSRRRVYGWDATAVYEWDVVDCVGTVYRGARQPETLAEWSRKHGRYISHPAGGTCVITYVGGSAHRELYGLRDYAVSTVGMGVAWLVPRDPLLALAQEKNVDLAS